MCFKDEDYERIVAERVMAEEEDKEEELAAERIMEEFEEQNDQVEQFNQSVLINDYIQLKVAADRIEEQIELLVEEMKESD